MFIVGVLVVIGIGVGVLEATGTAGLRNTTAHAITLQSPVQTAYGWFKSVNNRTIRQPSHTLNRRHGT